jgi:hypothetical protein
LPHKINVLPKQKLVTKWTRGNVASFPFETPFEKKNNKNSKFLHHIQI